MTQREKTLAGVLLGLLVFVGGGAGGYLFVYRPLRDVRTRLSAAEGQLTKKEQDLSTESKQIEDLLRFNPRLTQWAKLSLPPRDPKAKQVSLNLREEAKKKHLSQMQVEYESYLYKLLVESGMKTVKVSPRPIERRAGQNFRGPQPVYEQLAFTVDGQGSMSQVAEALYKIHKTPLLHKVRSLTLNTATTASPSGRRGFSRESSDGTLTLNMTVEALMVAGGEERSTLMPDKLAYDPKVLATAGRNYAHLDRRNMFTGFTLRTETKEETPPPPASPKEKPEDVLRFVKLTMLAYNPTRDRWEATIYDQAKGGAEKKLNARTLNELTVLDKYKNPVLEGKVVHIDESQLIFLANKKYYRLACGDFIHPAMKTTVKRSELRELDIEPEEDKAEEEEEEDEE